MTVQAVMHALLLLLHACRQLLVVLLLILLLVLFDIPKTSCFRLCNVHVNVINGYGYNSIHLVHSTGYYHPKEGEEYGDMKLYSSRGDGLEVGIDAISRNRNQCQQDTTGSSSYKYETIVSNGILDNHIRWTENSLSSSTTTVTRIDGFSPYRSRRQRLRYSTLKSYQSNHKPNNSFNNATTTTTTTVDANSSSTIVMNSSRTDSIPIRSERGTRQGISSSSSFSSSSSSSSPPSSSFRRDFSDISYYKPDMFSQQLEYDYLSPNSLHAIQLLPYHRRNRGDYYLTKWWHVAKKWGLLSGEMKDYADLQDANSSSNRRGEELRSTSNHRSMSINDHLMDTNNTNNSSNHTLMSNESSSDVSYGSSSEENMAISPDVPCIVYNNNNNNSSTSISENSLTTDKSTINTGSIIDHGDAIDANMTLMGSDGRWVNRLSTALRQHIIEFPQHDPPPMSDALSSSSSSSSFSGGMSRKDFNRIRNYKGKIPYLLWDHPRYILSIHIPSICLFIYLSIQLLSIILSIHLTSHV